MSKAVRRASWWPLSGYDTRLLTVAALNGAFQDRVDQTVNYVNAPVIAAERGIAVSEQRFSASQHYTNLVRVVVAGEGDEVEVSGTTVGPEPRLFLAESRGLAGGSIFTADGRLAVSVVQEGLARVGQP